MISYDKYLLYPLLNDKIKHTLETLILDNYDQTIEIVIKSSWFYNSVKLQIHYIKYQNNYKFKFKVKCPIEIKYYNLIGLTNNQLYKYGHFLNEILSSFSDREKQLFNLIVILHSNDIKSPMCPDIIFYKTMTRLYYFYIQKLHRK